MTISIRLLNFLALGATACSAPGVGLRGPSDPDSLLAGTYRVSLTSQAFMHRSRIVSGTLVLSAHAIPTRLPYMDWSNPREGGPRGCIVLSGDLPILNLSRVRTDSFYNFTNWARSSDGSLTLPVYAGVDYGYRLRLVIRNGSGEGTGDYYAPSSGVISSNGSQVHAVRVGPPDLVHCHSLPARDSSLAARGVH